MRIKRTCKICGDEFSAIKVTQFFCSRKCFKRDYYLRTKAKETDLKYNPEYPLKECAFCLEKSRLNFDPAESPHLYDAWGCPYCGATNALVWEHHNKHNSYQIIQNILISVQMNSTNSTITRYETYRLPVSRPEQGNPGIVVLACETMSITDIQKKNRKKLLFS